VLPEHCFWVPPLGRELDALPDDRREGVVEPRLQVERTLGGRGTAQLGHRRGMLAAGTTRRFGRRLAADSDVAQWGVIVTHTHTKKKTTM
jgi:hypothetical protein